MKEEALKLADELNQIDEVEYADLMVIEKAIVMIRRLVEELDECWCGGHSFAYLRAKVRLPQTKPLSDDEILLIYTKYSTYDNDQRLFVDIYGFARAIEERHGIK